MNRPAFVRGVAVVGVAVLVAALLVGEGVRDGLPVGTRTVDADGTWWFQWWVADAWRTGGSLMHTDRLFFPFGKDVLVHTGANVLDALLVAPFRAPLGPTGSWNLLVAAVIATNALVAGAVASRGGVAAGALGAVLGGLHPVLLHEIGQGRPTQAVVAPLVAALALGDGALRTGGTARLLAAGGLLALQGWFYWFYGLFGALALTVCAYTAFWRAPPGSRRTVVMRAALVLGVAALCAAPVAGPLALAAVRGEAPGLLDLGRLWREQVSYTQEGDAVPLTVLAGWGEAGIPRAAGFAPDGPVLTLGALLLAAAAPGRWRVCAVFAVLFAFGPALAGVPNPVFYAVTALLPPLARLWWPVRALVLLVPIAVFGLAHLGRHAGAGRAARVAAALLAVALIAEPVARGAVPLGTWSPSVPPSVALLAEAPRRAAVVLPLAQDQTALLYQAATGAPLLNGMYERTSAFVPPQIRALHDENSFLRSLSRALVDPRADLGFTEADRNAFVELGYGWIVVRRTALGAPEGPRARVAVRRLREMLGAPRAEDDAVFVWELPSAGSR